VSSQEHITISPLNSEKKSKNFDLLREEGIKYLQERVGDIWTDFNVHDPGVTILEQLCYALTDLAFRANLDIKDIIAIDENDDTTVELNNFFTAREILHNAPWTINDFRKLLIDLEGIKNAWIEITKDAEIDFYFDSSTKELTYTETADTSKVELNGLYEVLLEFDVSEEFGDLNDNTLIEEVLMPDASELAGLQLEITVEFPYWSDELPAGDSWSDLSDIYDNIRKIEIRIDQEVSGFEVEITVSGSNVISVEVAEISGVSAVDRADLATEVEDALMALLDITGVGDDNLLVRQRDKVAATFEVVDNAKAVLNDNRNLCEDFVRYTALKIEEIAICADIQLETDANTEEVLAEIYFLIGQFLAPDINFYSIDELLEKGKTTEEIFEGPRLNHGFIDTDELEATSRRKSIHVSDLINIIMDIDGVVAIRDMQIANIPLGDSSIISKSVHWCLELAWEKNFVPRLSPERSTITFIKKGISFKADEELVEDLLAEKIEEALHDNSFIPELDLEVPNGDFYDLDDYSSIQLDFPENYGIGEVGLPESVTDLRKAQAKQLKAFLLFFDQLLANYCSQLSKVREIFSMNSDIDKTYFNQPMFEIPNVAHLYKEFIDANGFAKDPSDDDSSAFTTQWEVFKAEDESTNIHRQSLNEIIEDEETFLSRRNDFLDHLLARFAEEFTDYAMLAYRIDGTADGKDLVDDKLAFLQEYPEISYNRGQAFDYLRPGWNNDNVSGLEKRVSRLLGIESYERRNLTYLVLFEELGKFKFKYVNSDGDTLLESIPYDTESERSDAISQAILLGMDDNNYLTDEDFFFKLIDGDGTVVATSPTFPSNEERDNALDELLMIRNTPCNGKRPLGLFVDAGKFKFDYRNSEGVTLWESTPYDTIEDRRLAIELAIESGKDKLNYRTEVDFIFTLIDEDENVLGTSPAFVSNEERDEAVEDLFDILNRECDGEGFYLLEHVLLRPRSEDDDFLPIYAEEECYCEGNEDVYSFKATCVMPYWIGRFDNMDFRKFVERTIREETPAHIFMKICWINQEQMALFQVAYKEWLEEMEICPPNQASLTEKQNNLIAILNDLRNVYPVSYLYDCEETGGDSPITLGQSILGTFTPEEDE
jgi:hypothetical protein